MKKSLKKVSAMATMTLTMMSIASGTFSTFESAKADYEQQVVVNRSVNQGTVFSGVADITIRAGEKFDALRGVTAFDQTDGDVTNKITVTSGTQGNRMQLVYKVTNSQNKTTTATRLVTMVATNTEFIKGVGHKTLTIGDKFDALAGVSAVDSAKQNVSSYVSVAGQVDTSKAGVYTLTYSLDAPSVYQTVTRLITVKAPNTAPVLQGIMNREIYAGEAFDALKGITATDQEDGDLTNQIAVAGQVDTTKAGTYTLTYSVTDSAGKKVTAKCEIKVVVKDNKPYFTNIQDQTVYLGEHFDAKQAIQAFDRYGVEITNKIYVTSNLDTSKIGNYVVVYKVYDKYGRLGEKVSHIQVIQKEGVNTLPVISGVKDHVLSVGAQFNPLEGITAYDQEEGDLTSKIQVTGKVDTAQPDTYELIYSVTDSTGAVASQKSTIVVLDKEAPSKPENVEVTAASETTLTIHWAPSTDNVGVAGYIVFLDGEEIAEVAGNVTSYQYTNLKPDTTYNLGVKAYDASGNISMGSRSLDYTTVKEIWNSEKVYVAGDVVSWNGKKYEAQYWTQGVEPGQLNVYDWKWINEDEINTVIEEWVPDKIYFEGETVMRNGRRYKARYWNVGVDPMFSTREWYLF